MLKEYEVRYVNLACGETLAYRQAGVSGPILLLLHGNMSSSLHYDVLMEALEGEYRLIAPDLRGFGDSTYHHPVESLEDFARDMAMFLTELELVADAVVGWSTGGGIALELAALYSEMVKSVILVNTVGVKGYPMFKKNPDGEPILTERLSTKEEVADDPVQVKPILDAYSTGNRELLRTVWNTMIYTKIQPPRERYERYLEAMLKQRNLVDVNYALIQFNMTHQHNGVNKGNRRLDQVQGPVLIIHGEDDMVVSQLYAVQAAALLGARATLFIESGIGHSPFTDDLPRVVKLITQFVTSHWQERR